MRKSVLFKTLLAGIMALFVLAACGNNEEANTESETDFPEKSITMIVPYAAGGTTDTTARALANVISDYLPNDASIAVENKDGGAGVVGMTEVAHANPDGYTIALATSGPMTIAPHTQDTSYDLDSFDYIAQAVTTPNILLVNDDSPWEDYDDFIEYVKEHPGEVTYGTSGAGNSQHISMEALADEEDLDMEHVPYEGGAPAITALLGGHIDVSVNQSVEALPQVESGELRALVNTGSYTSKGFEDVPLLEDEGVDVALDVWNAIVAPAGLPEEVQEILVDAFEQALDDERVIEQFDKLGIEPAFEPPEDLREIAEETYEKHGEVLENAGISE
ncbi:Bug family tripartite tricarboxylate transporter substrate binding protein [Virgibacillus natechei]|uniref:Bug family tripartite tricarboxylate transporter substrate binding protein n=1 Tax=Virgibacillus sp. CBA3643 TaxID=2942278 RepID=UPI0035A3837B